MTLRLKTLCFALLGLSLICTSKAQAAFVSLTGSPVPINSIPGGVLVAGDKQYSAFNIDGFAFGGAIAPDPSFFLVQGGYDSITNQFGLRFLTAMNAGLNQVTNANVSFRVDVVPQPTTPVGMAYMINAVTMVLSGVSTTGNGIVNASETVFGTSTPFPALANLGVSAQQGVPLSQLFDTESLPNPLSTIFIRKDIPVSGGATGGAHLSEFFQYYDQTLVPINPPAVPEPGIWALAGTAVAGVGYWRWKKNHRDEDTTSETESQDA
ncbi:MAG: hypothetical protein QM811_09320 [Pirellulales bacterium]